MSVALIYNTLLTQFVTFERLLTGISFWSINYAVEVSVATIIWPSGLHQRKVSHVDYAKSGADEGHWAKTSSIYINHQHLQGLHKRE